MNPWLCSRTAMSCGIHSCSRKCHNPQDHQDLVCAVKVQMELPCGHSPSLKCYQSKAPPDACLMCKLARRKAGLDKENEETKADAESSFSSFVPRPPTSPTSPTSSWRDRQATTTTDSGTWRNGRSTDHSTNVFSTYRGPGIRQSSDTYRDGLFGKPQSQSDSFCSSRRGSGGGSWRK